MGERALMATDLPPEPLVPPEVDLRDFAFMPLDVVRLRDSGLTAKASGDEFRAAVLLWCASWHQVPAASLPDDDDELANICGYSRARREWSKVRAGALRGWERCSDGRLYHRAVAGKALEAWIEKLASAIGGAAGNAKRWNVSIDTEAQRAQFVHAVACLRAIDPQSRTLRKKVVAVIASPSPPDSPPDRNRQGQGQGQGLDLTADLRSLSGKPDPAPPAEPKGEKRRRLNADAVAVLEFLNRATGSKFQPVEANLSMIRSRIVEFDVPTCKRVIASRWDAWADDEKMAEYLRPATLFAARNFAQYAGQLPPLPAAQPDPEPAPTFDDLIREPT